MSGRNGEKGELGAGRSLVRTMATNFFGETWKRLSGIQMNRPTVVALLDQHSELRAVSSIFVCHRLDAISPTLYPQPPSTRRTSSQPIHAQFCCNHAFIGNQKRVLINDPMVNLSRLCQLGVGYKGPWGQLESVLESTSVAFRSDTVHTSLAMESWSILLELPSSSSLKHYTKVSIAGFSGPRPVKLLYTLHTATI